VLIIEERRVAEVDRRSWLRRDWARAGWLQTLATGLVVAVVMAAAGGFETGKIPLFVRFPYWIGLIASGVVVAQLIRARVLRSPWMARRRWLAAAAIALATTLPMTLLVVVSTDLIQGTPIRLDRAFVVFPDVLWIAVGTTILAVLVQGGPPGLTHEGAAGAPPAKFLSRLPSKLEGATLLAVEAEDHYLRLHTSKGADLILMRLSDAIVELEGIEGAQTHRSWWVARLAVASAERAEGRATLTLTDGTLAPVSRSYLKPLREAGWF
jgi:hypothetical protein